MAATVKDIRRWYEEGKDKGAKFVVIRCDTYDWSDYPVFCTSDTELRKTIGKATGPGQRIDDGSTIKVMEVYDLGVDLDEQLAEYRAWHIPDAAG